MKLEPLRNKTGCKATPECVRGECECENVDISDVRSACEYFIEKVKEEKIAFWCSPSQDEIDEVILAIVKDAFIDCFREEDE